MLTVGTAPHALEYVAAAAIVCLLSSWAAFQAIAKTKSGARLGMRRAATVAVSLGLGAWSTHFIAMLGIRPDLLISYSAPETIGSIFISLIAAGGAMAWAARRSGRVGRFAGACVASVGVSTMHHVGMVGLSGCFVAFNPFNVALPTIVTCFLFALALELTRTGARFAGVKAAVAASLGVITLHFGSIAGTTITIGPDAAFEISPKLLAALQFVSVMVLLLPFYRIARSAYETSREIRLTGYVAMATGEGVVSMDADGVAVWVNDAFERLTGMRFDQFETKCTKTLVRVIAEVEDADRYEAAIRTGRSINLTAKSRRPNGEIYWQNIRLIPRLSDDGAIRGFVSAHREVTAEVRARHDLERSEAEARQLAIVARHASDAIVIADDKGLITWINESFVRLTGYEPEEVMGRKAGEILQGPETSKSTVREIGEALRRRKPVKCEILNYTKTGAPYWIQLSVNPVQTDDGAFQFVATSRDISQRIKRERRMVEALRQAEEADRLKSEFLARMSHEIRTPMNGVTGMAEVLATTDLDENQTLFLDHIRSSSARLLRVVNDILDFSTIDEGKVSLKFEPFSLPDLLEETLGVVRADAAAKGLDLAMTIGEDVPGGIVGDHGRIQQILLNLLSNAVKFTETGSVTLTVKRIASPSRNGVGTAGASEPARLRFDVADTGAGIPASAQATVFDRFTQVDGSARRSNEGAGLGLSIAAGLADAMGGSLSLRSAVGEGSTFTFDLVAETTTAFDEGFEAAPAALAVDETAAKVAIS